MPFRYRMVDWLNKLDVTYMLGSKAEAEAEAEAILQSLRHVAETEQL